MATKADVIKIVESYEAEAKKERAERDKLDQRNMDAFNSKQDFSYKADDQSTEFLPRTFVAAERFVKFIKDALIQSGNEWFEVEPGISNIEPEIAKKILGCYLDNIGPRGEKFADLFEDALKFGLLKSLMIVKVSGARVSDPRLVVSNDSKIKQEDLRPYKPVITVIDPEDYLVDPTGSGLYEIHCVKKDFHEIQELAKAGIYDKKEVEKLKHKTGGRNIVELKEVYGTFIDKDGEVLAKNALATVADGRYLIRDITKNPFWHNSSPFVTSPLVRVPGTVWHKALYDSVVDLNFVLNEVFNLMLDGGIGSAVGVKQVRAYAVEDPRDISSNVRHGQSIPVRPDFPFGAKVVEHLPMGEVPRDAFQMYAEIERVLQEASMLNDLALGQIPGKEVRATEVVQAMQSQGVLLNGIVRVVEDWLSRILHKLWLVLIQNLESLYTSDIVSAIGYSETLRLSSMDPVERFDAFSGCGFKVTGISGVIARGRSLARMLQLLQIAFSNPLLSQAFIAKFDPAKVLDQLVRLIGIDADKIKIDEQQQILNAFNLGGALTSSRAERGEQQPNTIANVNVQPNQTSQSIVNEALNQTL